MWRSKRFQIFRVSRLKSVDITDPRLQIITVNFRINVLLSTGNCLIYRAKNRFALVVDHFDADRIPWLHETCNWLARLECFNHPFFCQARRSNLVVISVRDGPGANNRSGPEFASLRCVRDKLCEIEIQIWMINLLSDAIRNRIQAVMCLLNVSKSRFRSTNCPDPWQQAKSMSRES